MTAAAFSGGVMADSVGSVSCSTPTAPLAQGSSACSAVGLYGYAQAAESSSVVLPTSGAEAAEIDASLNASAMLAGIRGITSVSTAQSTNDVNVTFDTTGAVRNGFLDVTFVQSEWGKPVNGSISELLQIGSYNASPDGNLSTNGNGLSVFIPIQLGTNFDLDFQESIIANGDAGSGVSQGGIGADITVEAFEGDGTTPVELFDPTGGSANSAVPEPTTLGMMSVAMLMSLGLIHRFRR